MFFRHSALDAESSLSMNLNSCLRRNDNLKVIFYFIIPFNLPYAVQEILFWISMQYNVIGMEEKKSLSEKIKERVKNYVKWYLYPFIYFLVTGIVCAYAWYMPYPRGAVKIIFKTIISSPTISFELSGYNVMDSCYSSFSVLFPFI